MVPVGLCFAGNGRLGGIDMTENEAIERIKTGICCEKGTARYCTDACMYGKEKCAYSVAIKALKEIQQYRELEKRLTGMFSG